MIQANADHHYYAINDEANVTFVRSLRRHFITGTNHYTEGTTHHAVVSAAGVEQAVLVKSAGSTYVAAGPRHWSRSLTRIATSQKRRVVRRRSDDAPGDQLLLVLRTKYPQV